MRGPSNCFPINGFTSVKGAAVLIICLLCAVYILFKVYISPSQQAPVFVPVNRSLYRNPDDNNIVHVPPSQQAPVFVPVNRSLYRNPDDNNMGECLHKYFQDILLIIIYHFPFYDSIPLLKSFYKDAFRDILICGQESYEKSFVMKVAFGPGWYGYECAGEAIRRYPGYRGYLYINDDMVVNWWNFAKLDKEKLWQGGVIINNHSHVMGNRPIDKSWCWWKIKTRSAEACEDSYLEVTNLTNPRINVIKLVKLHQANGKGKKVCFRMWSDLFYIPNKFSYQFQLFSHIFHKNKVFLEVAVPTIMSFLDHRHSWEKIFGLYLPDKYGSINFADGKLVWREYTTELNFIHPVKFCSDVCRRNREKLKGGIMNYSKRFTKC